MGMSRWWMLGAVLPLVTGCGGGSSSTDDRERFGVVYTEPTSSDTEEGLPLFTRLDLECLGTKNNDNGTPDNPDDDTSEQIVVDLGIDAVQMTFAMNWINNELGDQSVELTGDGFRVSVYEVSSVDGARADDPIWHSDADYFAINEANGNNPNARYFESLEKSGVEVGSDSTDTYYCNDDWQRAVNSLIEEDEEDDEATDEEKANPYQFYQALGVIGENENIDVVVGNDDTFSVVIPQSEELPGAGVVGERDNAGRYYWWGLNFDGDAVDANATYEAVMEVRVCVDGEACEFPTKAFRFRLADKAVEE